MADSGEDPTSIDGAPSLCNLLVAALATLATLVLPRIGANEFGTLDGAYAAVAQAAAPVGAMVVKAGAKKTQKLTPLKVVSPPFGGGVLVGGFYPQMSMRLRCGQGHGPTYEPARHTCLR